MNEEVIVDEELRAWLPRLSAQAVEELEVAIGRDGCRDAMVVWRSGDQLVVVDGHTRLEICRRRDVEYHVVQRQFADRDAVKAWIEENQRARRNLTPAQLSLLRGRRFNREKGAPGRKRAQTEPVSKRAQTEPVSRKVERTAERIAREEGVGRETIKRDAAFAAKVDAAGEGPAIMAGTGGPRRRENPKASDSSVIDPDNGKPFQRTLIDKARFHVLEAQRWQAAADRAGKTLKAWMVAACEAAIRAEVNGVAQARPKLPGAITTPAEAQVAVALRCPRCRCRRGPRQLAEACCLAPACPECRHVAVVKEKR